MGILLTLAGIFYYTYVKIAEGAAKQAPILPISKASASTPEGAINAITRDASK